MAESRLSVNDLVMPCFWQNGNGKREAIPSMPGIFRFSPDAFLNECERLIELGIKALAPFPAFDDSLKDKTASISRDKNNFYLKGIENLKRRFPEMLVFSDVAMDPYSPEGHDGLVENGKILNDETLPILAEMALAQAEAGSDFVAPSDMMDGRVGHLRKTLDRKGFSETGILSYTAKYASAFYSPFREALDSAPKEGDKKTYQMNPANAAEALREAELDAEEGADVLMVKPGLAYLDILHRLKSTVNLPLATYNVSGEYLMMRQAFGKEPAFYKNAVSEILTAFKRAGADVIFTYHATEVAEWLADS